MMRANPYAKYKQMETNTTDPLKLVIMLYDGAIQALKRSIDLIDKRDYEGKFKQLDKAQNIIFELMACLDHNRGGDVAKNLNSLYTFMITRILEANASLDVNAIAEVIVLLENLNDSWKELGKRKTGTSKAAANVSLGNKSESDNQSGFNRKG